MRRPLRYKTKRSERAWRGVQGEKACNWGDGGGCEGARGAGGLGEGVVRRVFESKCQRSEGRE